MIKDWLKKQLIPEKRDTGLWPEFADSLQEIYEEQVEPILERISNRKSFFSMHPDDLDTRISEYGRFFVIGETGENSRPILLTQRLDEVHFKGTDRPIVATFWREFANLPVTWEPLYAPVDQNKFPYGTFFTTALGVEVAEATYGKFFLTSRGTVNVDLNKLYEIYGYDEQEELIQRLINDFDRIVAPLLPLEIVFNGITLRLDFWLEEAQEVLKLQSLTSGFTRPCIFQTAPEILTQQTSVKLTDSVPPLLRSLDTFNLTVDTMPADAWRLDVHILIPPILPTGPEIDSRLRKVGSRVLLDTLGQWGCIVELTTGEILRFSFPGWAAAAVLPVEDIYPNGIRKISYCSERDAERLILNVPEECRENLVASQVGVRAELAAGESGSTLHHEAITDQQGAIFVPGKPTIESENATIDKLPADVWQLDVQMPK